MRLRLSRDDRNKNAVPYRVERKLKTTHLAGMTEINEYHTLNGATDMEHLQT